MNSSQLMRDIGKFPLLLPHSVTEKRTEMPPDSHVPPTPLTLSGTGYTVCTHLGQESGGHLGSLPATVSTNTAGTAASRGRFIRTPSFLLCLPDPLQGCIQSSSQRPLVEVLIENLSVASPSFPSGWQMAQGDKLRLLHQPAGVDSGSLVSRMEEDCRIDCGVPQTRKPPRLGAWMRRQ